MKKILIALAAALSMGAAFAQPPHHRQIPDRVERYVVREGDHRVVTINTYHCTAVGHHGYCRHWSKHTKRRVIWR